MQGIESIRQPIDPNNAIEPIETAQDILTGYINRSGVKLAHMEGSNRAYYTPSTDKITLPVIGQFESAAEYYSTAFHEAAHSTGHKKRLSIGDNHCIIATCENIANPAAMVKIVTF